MTGNRILLEHESHYGLRMDALVNARFRDTFAFERRTLLWFGHGCTGHRMLSKHERFYGFAMDALDTVCSQRSRAWLHL